MKKYFSMLAMATVLFASSCNKTTENVTLENNETPITLSPEFAELQNSLYELNQEMIPSMAETRSWKEWLGVGISDAVGAACGFKYGGIWGSIILGAVASTIAIVEFQPWENSATTINRFGGVEQEFQSSLASISNGSGVQAGIFHNKIIRSSYMENGDELFEKTSEELVPMFREALPDGYENDLSLTNEMMSEAVQDFVYSPESGKTTTAFVQELCEKYPESAQELIVLMPILDGINASQSDRLALDYTKRVMKAVTRSKISKNSINTILCGTSVAFESKMLWNLNNQNN